MSLLVTEVVEEARALEGKEARPAREAHDAAPITFSASGRGLAGWLHPPRAARRGCGVVLCAPLGFEAICAARALRHLAVALAAAGFPTLRFDYDGTGDSVGGDRDPDRLSAWLRSTNEAIDELARRAGVDRIALVGVRLGATFAAAVAAARDDVSHLVLITPCASGRSYLREQRALQQAIDLPATPPGEVDPAIAQEAAGFAFTVETAEALAGLDLAASLRGRAAQSVRALLLLERDDLPAQRKLHEALRAGGAALTVERTPGHLEMLAEPHKTAVPAAIIEATVRWLSLREPPLPVDRPPSRVDATPGRPIEIAPGEVDAALPTRGPARRVREEPFRCGAGDRLFGVLAQPASAERRDRPAIVLLNAGAVPHQGPNRLWVTVARHLAAQGFQVLRLDLSGLGESAPPPGGEENHVYGAFAVRDVRAALAALRARRGVERFVLVGLCSGAHHAFHAALADEAVTEVVLINPVTFYYKPGMSLELRPAKIYGQSAHYRRAIFRPETWRKALRGEVDLRLFGRVVRARAATLARAYGARALVRVGLRPRSEDLDGDLRALLGRGVATSFVFAAGEPGLDELRLRAPWALADRGGPAHRPAVRIIEGADHTFTALWAQRRLLAGICAPLVERHS